MNAKKYLLPSTFLLLLFPFFVFGQNELLQSGPMLGYSQMKEVLIWVQTNTEAEVSIRYWERDNKEKIYVSERVITEKSKAYTAKIIADQVQPGKVYRYDLLINDKVLEFSYPTQFQSQPLWQWRNDPPPVKFALGSCLYVNEEKVDRPSSPYGGEYEILTAIYKRQPEFMVWLGDNIYLREVDWFSRTGIFHRYTHTRSLPELQPLLASTHHYAIWDDHDFGPNNSDRSFVQKDLTQEAFELFWGNPSYGLPGMKGITSHFQWADLDFFLLDDRYFRAPNKRTTGERTMIGEAQLEWLIDGLKNSYSPFKFVCLGNQLLNTSPTHENYMHYYEEEREKIISLIAEEKIKGVVFLTGDRHHSELSQLTTKTGIDIYDLTISPLTAGAHDASTEKNALRVKGTQVGVRNFSILEVTGPKKNRTLNIKVFNSKNEELWSKDIISN